MHTVILGAGLAGLSAAHQLTRQGQRVTLLERESFVGGMAASWRSGPYWLDFGPHRFHTRDPQLEQLFCEVLDGEVVRRERLSRIYLRERFFQYPLQLGNVVSNLDTRVLIAALRDYIWARGREFVRPTSDANFEAWVLKRFGRTLYDMFFGTYTSKAWGMPCTEISADWAAQRISQTDLIDTIRKTIFPPKDGSVRSLVSEFLYPKSGGIGQLARKFAEKIRAGGGAIRLGSTVRSLEREGRRIRRVHFDFLGERESVDADWVINTAPVQRILPCIHPALPAGVQSAAQQLEHVAIVFVYLEVKRPRVSPDHWIYLPEKSLRVHRISEFKNFSDTSAPGDSTALCCEITCRFGDAMWNSSLEQAAQIAQEDLVRCGLLQAGEARPLEIARLPRAYPVYRVGYREPLDTLRDASSELDNWISTGRQGLFQYNNMDHSIDMGRHAAAQVERTAPQDYAMPGEHFG